jgi:tetraacyldisaccharide 4'-kinase
MHAPDFWKSEGLASFCLTPIAALWRLAATVRPIITHPTRVSVPVLCIGNLVVGGAGKTPLALAFAHHLLDLGHSPHFLTRGYGGRESGPLQVDPAVHGPRDVGDESLLLAAVAPTWVAHDRPSGGRAAAASGADIIIMDDGFQNPTLAKDLSVLAVDGGYGFGNRHVIPAGPLRESLVGGLRRADAAVVIGTDATGACNGIINYCPVFKAILVPRPNDDITGKKVFAFAGIGRPEKFYATLRLMGCTVVGTRNFADHHNFSAEEIMRLCETAVELDAIPVTTEKDYVRLPSEARDMIKCLPVALEWEDPSAPTQILKAILGNG